MTCTPHPSSRALTLILRLLALGLACRVPRAALGDPVDLRLPAQAADSALMALGRQANVELLFSFDDLHRVRSTAVEGRLEPDAALVRLLEGTGFMATRNGTGRYVVTALPQRGAIRGRLMTSARSGAAGVRVTIAAAGLSTLSDDDGNFSFPSVPAGTYHLAAASQGYQPIQVNGVTVVQGRLLTLDAYTVLAVRNPSQLEPFVVEAKSARAGPLIEFDAEPMPRTSIGDIDQPRTENDALDYNVFNRDQIARSGAVNLNEFLQREILDSDATTLPPERNGSTGAFASGSTNLNLRGYGADATIVLVDGRRLPEIVTALPASLTQGVTAPASDVNVIPLNLIERVEVLPVSASAIYSGSPVGGVINIVLRPDINATELTTTYTNALASFDAPQSTTSLLHGETLLGGRLHVRFNLTYTQVTPPTESELGFIQANLRAHPAPQSGLYRATPNVASADGTPLFGAGSPAITSVAPGSDGSGGISAFSGRAGEQSLGLFQARAGGLVDSPYSLDYPYGRATKSSSVYGSATYDVAPWLQAGFDLSGGRTINHTGFSAFDGNLVLQAASPFNPFGKAVDVTLNEYAPALGENYDEAHIDYYSAVAGLLFRARSNWQASLDAQYGLSVTNYRGLEGVDNARWQGLVDEGVYNPLRDTRAFGPPRQFYDSALIYYGSRGGFVTLGDYDTFDSSLRVTNTSFMLPTGSSTINIGGDYHYARLGNYVDALSFGDGSLVAPAGTYVGRSLQRVSTFGELQSPLLRSTWLPAWVRDVETDVAVRYTASSLANEANYAPTAAIKVDFSGGLTLRATYATSNTFPPPYFSSLQAASIGKTGSGVVQLTPIFDPRRGNQQESVLVSDAINPNLVPEAAVTQTLGIVYERGTVHHFRASLDFANTVTSGEQEYLDATSVVDLEGIFPGRIVRAPAAAGDPYGVGVITSVLTGNFNLAWRHSYEWTGTVDYAWTECLGGTLDIYGRMIYYQRYDLKEFPNTPTVDELNAPDGTTPGLLKERTNFGASWANKGYGFGMDGQYFHARTLPETEWAAQGSEQVDPYWQFDAYLQSDLGRWLPWASPRFGVRGQVRVDNVFDAGPPRYANDPTGAGVQSYTDWRGRFYSVSVTVTF